jgi:ATP adenylyltransferase
MARPLWAPWRVEYVEHADEPGRCVFCDPEPALLLHRGEEALALLNRFPYSPGHLLVAPSRHVATFEQLHDGEALEIHRLTATGLAALAAAYGPHGYNLGWNLGRVAGAGIVDHIHLHIVPRWSGDTNFMPVLADIRVIPEALEESARRLREAWAEPGEVSPS